MLIILSYFKIIRFLGSDSFFTGEQVFITTEHEQLKEENALPEGFSAWKVIFHASCWILKEQTFKKTLPRQYWVTKAFTASKWI